MYNHAPKDYHCPFCLLISGVKNEHVHSTQSDIVYQDHAVTALISSHQYPNNPGNTIIVPNEHFENIFDLPLHYAQDIHRVAKLLALAMKQVYTCDGVSTRQHNEPAGNQDVWHYHQHVTLGMGMTVSTHPARNSFRLMNDPDIPWFWRRQYPFMRLGPQRQKINKRRGG